MINVTKQTIKTGNHETFLNRAGDQNNPEKILFLHGSGPGVSAIANWKHQLRECSDQYDCLAPDLIGFAQSGHPDPVPKNRQAWMRLWVDQVIALLDELGIQKVNLVGNSLGCSIAIELLIEYPERFDRVILMGPGGTPNTTLSPELARAKGFYDEPSLQKMTQILSWFVYDEKEQVAEIEEVAEERFATAMQPEVKRSNASIFATAAVPIPTTALERIEQSILLVHGREDRVCSVDSSHYLFQYLKNAQLHIFSNCGHWTQIEQHESFSNLANEFFAEKI